jgi:hypothetical protein
MTDNFAIRQEILDRLGTPEPELPGVMFMGTGTKWCWELEQMFDDLCMQNVHDRKVLERVITKLEQVRARDYQAFYLGRSELLTMYPVYHELPNGPEDTIRALGYAPIDERELDRA